MDRVESAILGAGATGRAVVRPSLGECVMFGNHYKVECFDFFGRPKWVEEFENIVVNAGLNDILDKYLKGAAYTAAWFVGLIDASPTIAAGDTMASHAGWAEILAYQTGSPTDRPALTLGSVSSQSVDNSGSPASFTITADSQSIGGAFVVDNSEAGGTNGTLYGAGAFTGGNKAADEGDTLEVTVTLTAAAS